MHKVLRLVIYYCCECRQLIFGRRAFSVAGPTVWNSLPTEFRDLSLSFGDFRRSLQDDILSRDISALSAIEMHCILLRYINFLLYSIQ